MMSLLDLQVEEKCGIGQLVSHCIRPILLGRSWRRACCDLPMPALSPKAVPVEPADLGIILFLFRFRQARYTLYPKQEARLRPRRRFIAFLVNGAR